MEQRKAIKKHRHPGGVSAFSGAGYGNRTRLHGLGSRCITDIRTLHSLVLIIAGMIGKFKTFLSWILAVFKIAKRSKVCYAIAVSGGVL